MSPALANMTAGKQANQSPEVLTDVGKSMFFFSGIQSMLIRLVCGHLAALMKKLLKLKSNRSKER